MGHKNTDWILWICEDMSMLEAFFTIAHLGDMENDFYDF